MNRRKSKRQRRETKRDSKEITTVDKTIADESTKKITRKGRRPKASSNDDAQEKTQSQKAAETIEASTQQEKRKRDTKVKRQTPNVMPEVEKVVDEFVKYTTETAGVDGLRKECRIVLDFKPEPGTYSKFEASQHLNRYPEIPCLDETRVVLQPSEGCDNDYIHANRVKMEKLDREFILTQGPKSNTVEDFWRMVFQVGFIGCLDRQANPV